MIKKIFGAALFTLFLHHTSIATEQKMLTLSYPKTPDWSLDESFLQYLARLFQADVFVESGTYRGGSTERAARHFKEVHSIELSPELFRQAQQRLEPYHNIHLYCGDSSTVLPGILAHTQGTIVFWLDGHYSEGNTAQGSKNTPVLEELIAIKNSGIKNAIILVDDMRCFQRVDNRPENRSLQGYPSVAQLKDAILAISPDYQFYIFGDTAIAFPASCNVSVSPVIAACTISRLSMDQQTSHHELSLAENTIANAQGIEKAAIKTLCDLFAPFARSNGIGGHYFLWYSLILAREGINEASERYHNLARSLGVTA